MSALLNGSLTGPADFVRIVGASSVGVRQGSATVVMAWCDLLYVRSDRKRTWISTTHGILKSSGALADVVDTLSPLGLVRIHRGVAVNESRVRRLAGQGRHRLILTLDTGEEFLVGRQFQRSVRSRFGFLANRMRSRPIGSIGNGGLQWSDPENAKTEDVAVQRVGTATDLTLEA